MNKRAIGVFIVIVFCGVVLLLLLRDKKTTIINYPPRQGPVIAFGDSLVYGYGAAPGNDFVSLLSGDLGVPIVNMGINGNTTRDGLGRVESIIVQKPSVVIVLLGGNDFLRKVPITETFSNLESIISKLQQSGAVVVLLGVQGGVFSDPFAKEFARLAQEKGVAYVPNVLDGIIGTQSLLSDAVHPNDAGYKKIAEKVLPILRKMVL